MILVLFIYFFNYVYSDVERTLSLSLPLSLGVCMCERLCEWVSEWMFFCTFDYFELTPRFRELHKKGRANIHCVCMYMLLYCYIEET